MRSWAKWCFGIGVLMILTVGMPGEVPGFVASAGFFVVLAGVALLLFGDREVA